MDRLDGRIRNYAWGSQTAIPRLLGREADGQPQAEYWLGAHPLAPALLAGVPLDAYLEKHPAGIGAASRARFGDKLPYLMKILAAAQALSIQAHPSREQAEEGFAFENGAGTPLDSPERTYRDDWPKPELLVALEPFEALVGFRDPHETAELFAGLGVGVSLDSVIGPLTERRGSAALAEVFLDVLSLDADRMHLVTEVCAAAVKHMDDDGPIGEFARTAVELDEHYAGDPGILAALLMNRVTVPVGQGVFLPAGVMHAYLKGTGIEVMANSDNVIRGGLTPKHIDVSALVGVVEFAPHPVEFEVATEIAPGIFAYARRCPEFQVWRLEVSPAFGAVEVPASDRGRVVLLTAGHLEIAAGDERLELRQGEATFLPAGDRPVLVSGDAQAFMSGPGV
ncbi:mannose-6-phosphate isomerase, class I [Propionicicella superfundia]|uniref:mannose-6-phosphate isomerase, class I n=1 Tax=Propionicicella superfundia TaxID=348582 RepID=UPI000406A35A|nr:mannose-6-phosphate isomerase, class I [Propionicicella superfundia]